MGCLSKSRWMAALAAAALLWASPSLANVLLGDRASLAVDGSPIGMTALDVDRDGVVDLVTANEAGGDGPSLSVLRGYGNGSFRPEERLNLSPARFLVHSVVAGDFDASGDSDLAVAVDDISTFPPQAKVLVYRSDGRGQFLRPAAHAVGGVFPRCLGAGDFDADGDLDLVVCVTEESTGAGAIAVLVNAGDAAFTVEANRASGAAPRSLEVADVDADGVADAILVDGDDDELRIFYGSKDIGLQVEAEWIAVGSKPTSARVVADADGSLPQIFVTTVLDSGVLRLEQPAAREFVPLPLVQVDDPPSDGIVVDLDADGSAEFVTISASNDRLSIYRVAGDGLDRAQRLTVDDLATALVVADFDANGRPDLAVPAAGADSANVFLNGLSPVGTPAPTSVGPPATPTPGSAATPTAPCTPSADPSSPCGYSVPTFTATRTETATPTRTPTVDALAPTQTPTATATSTPLPLPGDANCDGFIDSDDVSAIVFQMFQPHCSGADVNGDGMMSAADIVLLMEILEEMP